MNNVYKKLIPIIVFFHLIFASNAQNLLTNGDFSQGFTNWQNLVGSGTAVFSLTTTDTYNDAQAMSLIISKLGANSWDIQSINTVSWSATVGKTYTISFYAKSLTAGSQLNVVQQNTTYSSTSFTLTSSWALYQYSYVALEVSPAFKIQFPQTGTYLIDDISVIPYGTSTNNNLTINPATTYQNIEGFGGAMYYYNNWIADNPNSDSIYWHLFQDLSLDWIRLNNDYSYQTNFTPTTDLKNIAGAKKYNPALKLMMSAWSPPANLKNNNSTTNGGTLKKHWLGTDSGFVYNDYAQWWRKSIIAYNAAGINLTYISLQNEPDITTGYQSCRFNGTEGMSGGYAGIDKSIDSVYNSIKDLSYAPMILGSESFEINPGPFSSFNTSLKSKSYVHGYNYHLYDQNSSKPDSFDPALANVANNFSDKPNYMTEYTLSGWFNTAQVINKTLSIANSSVFYYWDVAYPGSQVIDIDCNYNDCYPYTFKYPGIYFAIKPNYYAIKHFSKFIQPGYKRIAGSTTNTSVQNSAYINPTGSEIVVVLLNTETIAVTSNINLTGYKIVGSQVYQSTTGSYFVNKGALSTGNSLLLPDSSVTTVVLQVQPSQCSSTITASGATTFCQGSSVVLTANSGSSYVWYNGTAQVGTSSTYIASNSGSYTVKVTNAFGCSAISLATSVTVNALPTAPIVTSSITYCQNATPTVLSATGTGLKWYTSATGGIGLSTAPTPSIATAGTTNYYVSQTVTGCEGPRAMIAVTVNALPVITQYLNINSQGWLGESSATVCSGSSVQLGPWPTTTTGWVWTGPGGYTSNQRGPTISSLGSAQGGVYTSTYTDQNGCKASSAVTLSVSVPTASITSGGSTTFCQGSSVALTANTGSSYIWYNGTTQVGTSSTYMATSSGSYTVSVTNGSGCQVTSAPVVITVNALPSAPSVSSPVTYCQNAMASVLSATGTGLKWYTASTGGTGSSTLSTPNTATAGTTNYYVSQTVNGCEGARAMIAVTVNALPTAPTVTSPITYCQNATPTVLSATGAGLKWYTSATGGIGLSTAPTPSIATAGTTNYYVSQTVTGCEGPRAMIAVTVNALPAAPTVTSPITYCQNATATALTAKGTNLNWYTSATGGIGIPTAPTPSTITSGTTSYYVSQTINSCESPRAVLAVIVNQLSGAVITSGSTMPICIGTSAVLRTSNASNYSWSNGTSQVGTGQTYTATAAGSYTVTVNNGSGCTGTSAAFVVSIASQKCYDCANVLDGTATIDNCGVCTGGTTGLIACTTTGTIGGISETSILVYPQPFENTTKVELKNGGNIESIMIYSSTGALVYTKDSINRNEVEIGESFADGLYNVIVQAQGGSYTTKIVKVK